MKYNATTKRLDSQVKDSTLTKEIAINFNQLSDALEWFNEKGVKVAVRTTGKGYNITLSK